MPVELPFRFDAHPLLWTIPNVYAQAECDTFIDLIVRAAPRLATNNPLHRDQDRIMIDDATMAEDLFQRLAPHLPAQLGDFRLLGLNERLRFYRYAPGQQFPEHMDHWYQPAPNRITLHTVLVYFNDNFEGGETRFSEQLERTIVPQRGLVAIFQHKVRHEGCAVRSGTKYAMRTEVLFEAPDAIVLPQMAKAG